MCMLKHDAGFFPFVILCVCVCEGMHVLACIRVSVVVGKSGFYMDTAHL